jgi:hypothetical protein
VRNGDNITAFLSTNGTNWLRIAKNNVQIGSTSYIGLMVCGGSDAVTAASFDNVSVKP